jgi:hypothetical protein
LEVAPVPVLSVVVTVAGTVAAVVVLGACLGVVVEEAEGMAAVGGCIVAAGAAGEAVEVAAMARAPAVIQSASLMLLDVVARAQTTG